MGQWRQLGLFCEQRRHLSPKATSKLAEYRKNPAPKLKPERKRGPKPASRDLLDQIAFDDPLDDPLPF